MRILFWVSYPTEGSSNRFRVEQYLPYLKKMDISYSLRPFWESDVYKILYDKGYYFKKIYYFLKASINRFIDLINLSKYDLVFVHREAYPIGIAFLEKIASRTKPLIYDFDDALFIPSVSDSNRLIGVFKNTSKTRKIIKMSDYVIAGNNFLKDYALNFNKNVTVLPTPIDTDKYRSLVKKNPSANVVIGWIGSATTIKYLNILSDVFTMLFKKYDNVSLSVIGGNWERLKSSKIVCKEWRLESEVEDLQSFDIGIMPLTDDDWSRGKCAFKIIEYMAVGIPVVASCVGMNTEVICDGINGFLVNKENEWIEKLSLLIENPQLRQRISLAGRKTIKEKYSVKVSAPKFLEVIHKVYKE